MSKMTMQSLVDELRPGGGWTSMGMFLAGFILLTIMTHIGVAIGVTLIVASFHFHKDEESKLKELLNGNNRKTESDDEDPPESLSSHNVRREQG